MEQPEDMASLSEFDSLAGSIPATKVEITVSCRNLLDKDMFSKSDPLCVMYTQGMENKQWREFGRTEVIDNTLNPDFVRKFIVDYFFEEKQNLRFDLYDVDSKSPDLSKHDFLGQAFCTLGEIVGSPGSRLEKPLTIGAFSLNSRTGKPMPAVSNGSGLWMENLRTTGLEASGGVPGKKCGTIILSAEELSNCRDVATMQFCANKLDKKDFFGKSDPFLVFYRSNEDGTFTICHKTEVMKNTLNPVWQTFSIPVRALCNGDYDRTIKVEVYDWDRDGSHDFIGEFTTSYRELARGQSQFNIYEVVNPKKKMKKKKYVNSGTVTLLSFAVESECTFLDYIKGGTQINFTVAIDFTASNEWQPGEPFLLRHRWHPGGLPPQPAHCAALRPHQLRPGGDPRGQDRGRSAGRLPVLGAAHHHGRGHLGHGADQGGYRQCCQTPHVHHYHRSGPGGVRCHGGAGWR
ncbi:copine-5 isoform X3 [Neovison vison]|uniref:copine-5 isoform X3 n=1 Tax=Neovison vison TaxID=452646 RepID=UPI001CF06BDE|nr:copine-5 isoform X3 [Neogale vison]